MISALLVGGLLGAHPAAPLPPPDLQSVRRSFLADGDTLVSTTFTHRVVSFPDGTLELQGAQTVGFQLSTVQRARGPACDALATRRERSPEGQGLTTERACGVTERWVNHPAGLEHTLTLARPPAGAGDVLLSLTVDGPWHHQDARGHLFAGPGGLDGVRYGQAFVVGARGKVPIEVRRVPGGLQLRVPRALVEAPGAFPLTIDPVVSAEVPLDTSSFMGTTSSPESQPAVAVDGQGLALVVWTDTRRRQGSNIFGARVLNGALLDPNGLALVVDVGTQSSPEVAWNGSAFVLAWKHAPGEPVPPEIRTRTFTNGALGPITLVGPGTTVALSGVPDAGFAKVAWVDGPQIRTAVLANNTVANRSSVSLGTGYEATSVALASNGATSVVAWVVDAGTRGEVWTSFGGTQRLSSTSRDALRVTVALTDGMPPSAYLFWDEVGSMTKEVVGVVIDPATTVIQMGATNGRAPALFRMGTTSQTLALGLLKGDTLELRNLSVGGLIDSRMLSPPPEDLVIASGPWPYAAWAQPGPGDIGGAALGSGGMLLSPTTLTGSGLSQVLPRVALSPGSSEGVAVWVENDNVVRGAKVSLVGGGPQVALAPFTVVTAGGPVERLSVVAGANARFLVVWRERINAQNVIRSQLVSVGGNSGPPTGLDSAGAEGPVAAWDSTNNLYRVAWVRAVTRNIITRSVTPAGVADATNQLAVVDTVADLDVACIGGACLLAWQGAGQTLRARSFDPALGMAPTYNSSGSRPFLSHDGSQFYLGSFGMGLVFGTLDAAGRMGQLVGGISPSTTAPITQATLAPGVPPVLVYAEVSPFESTFSVQRLDLRTPAQRVPAGSFPSVATSSATASPEALLVFSRFETATGAMRAYALSLTWDGGGVDPGTPDGGALDAGTPDGGAPDGGAPDAGLAAGGADMVFTAGCGCDAASAGSGWLLLVLGARSRRRARR